MTGEYAEILAGSQVSNGFRDCQVAHKLTVTLRRFSKKTTPHSDPQNPAAARISAGLGEKISMNPFPFTSAEKLETQNGIRNNRITCHRSSFNWFFPAFAVLTNSANPMIALSPSEVSHRRALASKYRTSTTTYQIK
jgi:hypothetical protein